MAIPKVQLAFQGGGAKLAAMLPVAEAFLAAQSQGLVTISATSGTSAGAICAALVACKADISKAREYIQGQGSTLIEKMVPEEVKELSRLKVDGFGLINAWKYRNFFKAILFGGRPILDGGVLKEFLHGLFDASVFKNSTKAGRLIENYPSTKLTIIASNVAESKAVEHTSGDIVNCVNDSCSLPIIFRSFSALQNTHYVDGGICDNLPIECLLSDTSASIFAVYPIGRDEDDPHKSSNIVRYLLKLFSASINHNVSRSVSLVAEPFRFGVDTDIGLLDFDKAIASLQNVAHYQSELRKHLHRIREFSKSWGDIDSEQSRVVDTLDVRQYRDILTELTEDFSDGVEVQVARMEARVNYDVRTTQIDDAERISDTLTRIIQLSVTQQKIRYYRANLVVVNEHILPTIWSATNLTQKKVIPIRAAPLAPETFYGGVSAQCIIQFIDSGNHMREGDLIELRGVYQSTDGHDLAGMNCGQIEDLGFENAQHGVIKRAEVVVVYPKSIGRFSLSRHEKCTCTNPAPMEFDEQYLRGLGDSFDAVGFYAEGMLRGTKLHVAVARIRG